MGQNNIFDFTYSELEQKIKDLGLPKFRAEQLCDWLYKKLVFSPEKMLNLPKSLTEEIKKNFTLKLPTIHNLSRSKTDNSYKFLLEAENGLIEAILMLDNKRATICVSCMIGCPLACKFCATGSEVGFIRKLAPSEIVGQVLVLLDYAKKNSLTSKITNIVFMGMGEPLLNKEAVEKSIQILTHEKCFDLAPARISVSTAGVGPGLADFINQTGVRLAVSLHFPTDELRSEYMPVNKRFSLENLIQELRKVRLSKRDHILIEYLMLDQINDSLDHAKKLFQLIRTLKVKVNLIPYNATKTLPAKTSCEEAINQFAAFLKSKGIFCSVRRSKGTDIEGGCGQFALKKVTK